MSQLSIITHYLGMQFIKWIDINVGAAASLLSAFFGSRVLMYINPALAKDMATIIAAVFSILIAGISVYVAVKKAIKEMDLIKKDLEAKKRESEQDEVLHVLFVVSELEEKGMIDVDLSVEEKVEIAKNISQKIRNR